MSLWSRLRFMIDFDDDDQILPPPAIVVGSGVVIPNFITNLKIAIKMTIANYAGGSSTGNFFLWFTSVPSKTQFINNIDTGVPNPLKGLVNDIMNELVKIDISLSSYHSKISNIVKSSLDKRLLANALFIGGTRSATSTKQPITAMEPILIAQLCNDKLKNEINTAGLGITVTDGRRQKSRRADGKGRRCRSPKH
jgi:hypothetical protein